MLPHFIQQSLGTCAVACDQLVNANLDRHLKSFSSKILDDVLDDVGEIVPLRRLYLQLCSEEPVVVLRGLSIEHYVAELVLLGRLGVGAIS